MYIGMIKRLYLLFSILIVISSNFVVKSEIDYSDEELELLNKLFKNYNKNQKPDGATEMKFALNLNSIVNVKPQGVVELNAFLDHAWEDNRLSWSNCFNLFFSFENKINNKI
jgi:hypothetical protein